MQLSEKQRQILRLIQLRADLPIDRIAARVRLHRHSVARFIQRLVNAGVLRKSVAINLAPIGLTRYNLLFARSPRCPTNREQLVRDLSADPNIIYVGEIAGDFEYEVTFASRSAAELPLLMDRVSAKFKNGFFEKSLVTVLEKHLFGTKALVTDIPVPPLSLRTLCNHCEIDKTDHRLLHILANHNGPSQREIARLLGLPSSTVAYRINNLKERGIILGHYYILNGIPLKLLRFKILVYCRGAHSASQAKLYEFAKKHKNIDTLMVCVGAYDYELTVQVTDYLEVVTLGEQLRSHFKDELIRTKTFSCFENHKFSDYPFRDYATLTPSVADSSRAA
jgi:DNA-binding Lrp family transcriptional regulator